MKPRSSPGRTAPGLEAFDHMMSSFIKENSVPGAAVAITRRGSSFTRGFGYADVEKKEAVQPGDLFRIASISKPFTAVAVLQLVQKGDLKLDEKVVDHLKWQPFLEEGEKIDPRWKKITIHQVLQHTGGWDRDKSYDPIDIPWKIAKAMKKKPPITPEDIVRYMMGKPLDFDPGTRYAYSNLGYLLLGRVIEVVSGQNYERYVQKNVLTPLNIQDMKLGRASWRTGRRMRFTITRVRNGRGGRGGPHIGEKVPGVYGADNFESFQAHGGWMASAVDLVRFAAALDDPAHCPILKEKTIETMWARPEGLAGHRKDGTPRVVYYGCGWNVRGVVDKGKINTWHDGLIGGSSTLLVRRWDGLNWAVLFNIDSNPKGKDLASLIDPLMHETADNIKLWPEGKW